MLRYDRIPTSDDNDQPQTNSNNAEYAMIMPDETADGGGIAFSTHGALTNLIRYWGVYGWLNFGFGSLFGLATSCATLTMINASPSATNRPRMAINIVIAITSMMSVILLRNAYNHRSYMLSCCSGLFGSNRWNNELNLIPVGTVALGHTNIAAPTAQHPQQPRRAFFI